MAAQVEDVPRQLGKRLQQHQDNPDHHHKFDWPHIGLPDRIAPLAELQRIDGAVDPAIEKEGQIGDQEQHSEAVHPSLLSGVQIAIHQIHADIAAKLDRIGAADHVIADHHELGHFQRPQRWPEDDLRQ